MLSHNVFAYCMNDPVNLQDPSGNIAISTLIMIGGLVAWGAGTIYSAAQQKKATGKIDWLYAISYGAGWGVTAMTLGMGIAAVASMIPAAPSNAVSNPQKKLITGGEWNSYFKETYGSQNVIWENAVNSIDEIIDTPSLVTRMQPGQMAELAQKSGWNVGPLKNGRNSGILFENGGGISMNRMVNVNMMPEYIQFHPGSSHHGNIPYFKVSSPLRGTNRFYLE